MADKIKFVLALLLIVAGVAGFYLLGNAAMVLRVLCVIAGVVAGAAVGWTTEPGKRFAGFAGDSWVEARKVVWPTKKETLQTTGAVFAFVVVMAIVLFVIDKSVETAIYSWLLGWKS
ncbi:preprotein translocase subunit SecE [Uliginosibacterium sp. H3]|uniref:Protein translocase subunit SecE n=1 Tax=Uliginosibacterium silvisoli TaxID=3114758 RepID=A0ABU6JX69_9RHOO|nr:preprotein translocase subunit SecE [Uliginosibacterium sp. H3]